MAAVPPDANTFPYPPRCDSLAHCIDGSGDLMAGNTRIFQPPPVTLLYKIIAVTDSARFHAHAHLPARWIRNIARHDLEIAAGTRDLCNFHLRHTIRMHLQRRGFSTD
jgi:hypothetical protein